MPSQFDLQWYCLYFIPNLLSENRPCIPKSLLKGFKNTVKTSSCEIIIIIIIIMLKHFN